MIKAKLLFLQNFQDLIKTLETNRFFFSKKILSLVKVVFRNFRRKDNYEVALDNAEDYPELPEFDASQKLR